MSGQLAGLHHGRHRVSSWGPTEEGLGRGRTTGSAGWQSGSSGLKRPGYWTHLGFQKAQCSTDTAQGDPRSLARRKNCQTVVCAVATRSRQSLIWRHPPSLALQATPGVPRFGEGDASHAPCPSPLDGQAGGGSGRLPAPKSSASSRCDRVSQCTPSPILRRSESGRGGPRGDSAASCPYPAQVLPAPQVLALQHRRVQPVSAGGRRELPLQQAPQGTSPRRGRVGARLGQGPGQTPDTPSRCSSWTRQSAGTASWRRGKSATVGRCR